MKGIFAAAIVVCALSGCAHVPIYHKDGATQQQFAEDKYNCEKDARQSGYFGGGFIGAANMRNFFAQCMNAHGWYEQT